MLTAQQARALMPDTRIKQELDKLFIGIDKAARLGKAYVYLPPHLTCYNTYNEIIPTEELGQAVVDELSKLGYSIQVTDASDQRYLLQYISIGW